MPLTLASHVARPLRSRPRRASLALRLRAVERILGLIAGAMAARIPQVGP